MGNGRSRPGRTAGLGCVTEKGRGGQVGSHGGVERRLRQRGARFVPSWGAVMCPRAAPNRMPHTPHPGSCRPVGFETLAAQIHSNPVRRLIWPRLCRSQRAHPGWPLDVLIEYHADCLPRWSRLSRPTAGQVRTGAWPWQSDTSTAQRIPSSATLPDRYRVSGTNVASSRRTRAPPRTVDPVLKRAKKACSPWSPSKAVVSNARMIGRTAPPAERLLVRNRVQAWTNLSRRRGSVQKNTCESINWRHTSGRPQNVPPSVGVNVASGMRWGRSSATVPLSSLTRRKSSRFCPSALTPARRSSSAAGSSPIVASHGPAPSASMTCQTTG